MFRAIYLAVLFSIFTFAIAIPALAATNASCESEMSETLTGFLQTALNESDAPVTLIAANNPGESFRESVATLIKQSSQSKGYRFLSETPARLEIIDELKTQAGRAAYILLNIDNLGVVKIDRNNDLILKRQVLENLHKLAADWKKEGVDVRFFVMSKLVTETIPSEELNYSLQPVVSYKSKEYIPGYYDAYPAPAISPRFINVGSQTLVIVYPR